MSPKLIMVALTFLFGTSITTHATTWQTAAPGYWNNAGTWIGNTVPPYAGADTFISYHPVIFEHSLVFSSGANIIIDPAGGLCGHKNITMHAGADMLKYGLLELDSMFVPGGHVLCKLPKEVIFTSYAFISNGGYVIIDSCGLAVGPWFNCKLPEYNFQDATAVSTIAGDVDLTLFPNPNNGRFMLKGKLPAGSTSFELIDMTGRLVYSEILKGDGQDSRAISVSLSPGVYYWQLSGEGRILKKEKVVVGGY